MILSNQALIITNDSRKLQELHTFKGKNFTDDIQNVELSTVDIFPNRWEHILSNWLVFKKKLDQVRIRSSQSFTDFSTGLYFGVGLFGYTHDRIPIIPIVEMDEVRIDSLACPIYFPQKIPTNGGVSHAYFMNQIYQENSTSCDCARTKLLSLKHIFQRSLHP